MKMKMYQRVSVLLNLLFYFNFVNSGEHYETYKKWLELRQNEDTPIARYAIKHYEQICDTKPKINYHWASICKNVLHRMRKEKIDDSDNVFPDYKAFEGNEKCSSIDVSVPEWTLKAHQPVLFCFVRQAIIPLDGSIEPPSYKKLTVFPRTKKHFMVFKYNLSTEVYNLLHIFENFAWTTFSPIPPKVFDIPVPNSYSKINEIYIKLYDSVQGLETNSKNTGISFASSEPGYFQRLCEVTYRKGKYPNLTPTRIHNHPKGAQNSVRLLSTIEGKLEIYFRVTLYSCAMKDNARKRAFNYYLTDGPNENSVILVQRKENGQFVVIEYIVNLYQEYVELFRHYY